MTRRSALLLSALLLAAPLGAQEHEPAAAADTTAPHVAEKVDIITPHITDGKHLELPWILPPFFKEVELPTWKPVRIGSFELDLSPTKHVVMLWIGGALLLTFLTMAARAQRRQAMSGKAPQGATNAIEAMVLYIRNEVVLPNVGPHGEGFVPYLLTAFFFLLTLNLLGLIPYGSSATGNISVTATMAIMTFITVEVAGVRSNGIGYLNTMFYWNKDLNIVMRVLMFVIISPVEMLGKLARPFALAIRLFANMTAGHIVVLAFMGLFFAFAPSVASGAPLLMAVAIMVLELFVAFLQAFIFTLLSSVFIGQMRAGHH